MIATRRDAYKLIHQGILTMAEIESNGMAINEKYYRGRTKNLEGRIRDLRHQIETCTEGRAWKKKYRGKFNMDSGKQLGDMLYNELGYEAENFTKKSGQPSTKEEDLAKINSPLVRMWVQKNQLKGLLDKITDVMRETEGGFLRPFFNLHIPQSYRSSSDSPNGQNWYKRNKELAQIMREGIICRPGNMLTEFDFKGNEIKSAACYHHDPVMIAYLKDPTKDMHRDVAMDCYMLSLEQVSKDARYCGKNKFVFPQFFGDYYIACAKNLWEAIRTMDLRREDDKVSLKKHLKQKGIKSLFEFEKHIQRMERKFWKKRFKVYDAWKEDFWQEYCERGCLDMLTGFCCHELLTRNECINRPIQGTAFHWLLWCLIQLQKEIKKRKLKALIVGQIHDSAILDHPPEEADELSEIMHGLCDKIREHWPWIIVPMEIETERSEVDGNWWDMKEVK
jgi:DNA polymerase-1